MASSTMYVCTHASLRFSSSHEPAQMLPRTRDTYKTLASGDTCVVHPKLECTEGPGLLSPRRLISSEGPTSGRLAILRASSTPNTLMLMMPVNLEKWHSLSLHTLTQ